MSISANFPTIRPSLLLDFADTRLLDPRITFTRASTATFYDQTTTALAEQNLLTYSQAIGSTNWAQSSTTPTLNNAVAPDGTTTGSLITATAATAAHYVLQTFTTTIGQVLTISFYAKAGTNSYVQFAAGADNPVVNFDLSLGTVGTTTSVTSATITSAGSSWYRCTVTYTAAIASTSFVMSLVPSSSSARIPSWAAAGTETVFLWGAQLEQRSTVTAYTPTTTAAITNYIPVMQTAASGVARFDCNPSTGESLGLLIEESRVNLLTYSSGFDNAIWTKTNSTITSDTIVSPDGTLNGDKAIADATSSAHVLSNFLTLLASTSYTLSVYLKAAEYTFAYIFLKGTGAGQYQMFNLSTGVATATGAGTRTTSITSVGDGWYRCTLSITTGATVASNSVEIAYMPTDSIATYTGNGYSGVFIWGAQLEAGAFTTSYIPTVASQVTRAADLAIMTGTNFSSWSSVGSGSLYSEATSLATATAVIASLNGTTAGFEEVNTRFPNSGGGVGGIVRINNVNTVFNDSTGVVGVFYKQAVSYQNNSQAYSRAGSLQTSSSTGSPNTLNSFTIGGRLVTGSSYLNGSIKRITYYPKALTSTQLQAITS